MIRRRGALSPIKRNDGPAIGGRTKRDSSWHLWQRRARGRAARLMAYLVCETLSLDGDAYM